MANANQLKPSWDAFDKIFDEAFSRTKQTANLPPYFSPTPFTPYPPTDYGYESALTPYPGDLGRNIGHNEVEEQDFNAHTRDYHEESDRDEPHRFHYDDVYSRADMDYYDDDDYEKELWTKRARKAQAVGQGNSGVQKVDALKLTGVTATGFGSGIAGTNAMGLNAGSSAFSQGPQPNTLSQTASKPRPTITTNVNPNIGGSTNNNNNNNNMGTSSTSNPLANAMNAFSTAAATLNGLTNTLNNLGLGLSANSINSNAYPSSLAPSAPPRASAPMVSQVPTIAQPRPPIRKPPPPLNLDDSSSGSGSASSSSLDPTSPFKLSPGPSPPAPSAPPATAQYQAEFYPQHQGQFQLQQYQFQPDSQIPTSRSMFLQQQQHAQVQPKSHQGQTLAGRGQGQEQGKTQETVSTQARSQTQPIPVPAISKASTQAAIQESRSRSFERSTGVVPLVSPSPRSKAAGILSTSPLDSVDYDNAKSPAPSISTVHKKRRPNPGKVTFRNSPDGTRTTAMFDMQGIKKSDVHVSYQNDKVVVSWESVTVEDKIEDGKIVRERREKKFVRTLPLPEGTKFDQVKASMDGRHLNLTYPRFRS